jgi:hypothetical protein
MSITISSNRGKPLILGETQKMDDRPAIDTKRDKPGHVPAMSRFVPPHTGGLTRDTKGGMRPVTHPPLSRSTVGLVLNQKSLRLALLADLSP